VTKYDWSDASALWQLEHGADDARKESARNYLEARLEGYTKDEIDSWEDAG